MKNASLPRYFADEPSSSSIRRSWLYFATRSGLYGAPVLIGPALRATESGKKLLSELDKSGKTVTINQTNDKNGYEKGENYHVERRQTRR